jgi:hypothetical protein
MIFLTGNVGNLISNKSIGLSSKPAEDVSDNEMAIQFGTMFPEEDSQLMYLL